MSRSSVGPLIKVRGIVLLSWCVILAAIPSQEQSHAERDELVPRDEVLSRLQAHIDYLKHQEGSFSPNERLQVPARVHAEELDFYEANLAPLRASQFNVGRLHLGVRTSELARLDATMASLRKYEPSLQTLEREESDLLAREADVEEKRHQISLAVAAIDKRYQEKYGMPGRFSGIIFKLGTPPAVVEQYQREIQTVQRPLPQLESEFNSLNQKDDALARQYLRKTFTFELPSPYTAGNKVTPLIDGDNVWKRVVELLQDVTTHANGQGYVRLGFWSCNATSGLSKEQEVVFQEIERTAAAGNEVDVLLWDPSSVAQFLSSEWSGGATGNNACKTRLEKSGAHVGSLYHRIQGAYHEKTMLFFNGTELRAIVGGLNLAAMSSAPHRLANPGWNDSHDVAVELSGPSTLQVDRDFLDRWDSSQRGDSSSLRSRRSAWPGRPYSLGSEEVRIGLTRPELQVGQVGYAEPSVLPEKLSVEDELLGRIRAAEKDIYLENYSIHDEGLIRAIGERIAEAKERGQTFTPILLAYSNNEVYRWLHYITYQHLSFMACDSFWYTDANGQVQKVERKTNGKHRWLVGRYEGNFYQDTKIYWDNGSANLRAILPSEHILLYVLIYVIPGQLQAGQPNNFKIVPIHSKVSIFDDNYAGIGSANFNPRSMCFDGELTAFFHGPSVSDFRGNLWGEYGLTPPLIPEHWKQIAENNLRKIKAGALLPDHLYIVPIDWKSLLGNDPNTVNAIEADDVAAYKVFEKVTKITKYFKDRAENY